MDAAQMATFFGLILLGGAAGLILAVSHSQYRSSIAESAVPLAAAVATGATLGSLYFSESAGFVPCELCWFQRIAMYPLAIILGVAVMRRDKTVLPYALTLSVIGLGISAYHVQLQLFPEQSSFCEAANPCSGRWVEAFGWLTIPQMAGVSFALIALLASLAILTPDKDNS
jgi:disulfide bond formation protein DsbB